MKSICLSLGPITIHWYGVMMALGFLAGLANWTWLAKHAGRSRAFASDLLFWIMIGGLAGARILYVVTNPVDYVVDPIAIFKIWEGGLVYYGGFLGGITAVYLLSRRLDEPFWRLADFTVTSLPVAHALGRIGCLFNGCCYGKPTTHAPSIQFPADSLPWYNQHVEGLIPRDAPASLPVHPVQIYEALANLLIFAFLILLFRRPHRDGSISAAYLLSYPVARFALELLRGDDRLEVGSFSISQFVSLILFIAGLILLIHTRRKHVHTP